MAAVSCAQNNATRQTDITRNGDTVIVAENSAVDSKIKLHTVELHEYSAQFKTTGIVKPITGQMAEIAPPFDGRITKSLVRLGQRVAAGTPLFELHSPDFFEATKSYFQTLQAKKMQEANLDRQRDLARSGVGAVRELEEAETNYQVALTDYQNAAATMKMFNVDINAISVGEALKVTSPIAGEVVQSDIVIGQFIKSDAAPLVIVAELSKVWVSAQVKERYIGSVHAGDRAQITTDVNPEQIIAGSVSHVGELLNEETRSVSVLITCDNADRKLKPGMFTTVRLVNRPQAAVLVPSTALLQHENDTYVLVRLSRGRFIKRKVTSATAGEGESVIAEGLNAGEQIVAQGGIYLMAD
jgi:cobalt-zinc-cadmium efflux system membrane fusion protein